MPKLPGLRNRLDLTTTPDALHTDFHDELSEDIDVAAFPSTSSPTMKTKRGSGSFPPPSKLPKTTPKSDTAKAKDLLSELTTTVTSLDNQLRDAQAAATISKQCKADHAAEIKMLQRSLQTKDERVRLLEDEVSDLEQENAVLENAREELEEQISDIEAEKQKLEAKVEAEKALRTYHEQQEQQAQEWKGKADNLARLAKGLIESNAKGDFMAAGAFMRDLAKAVDGADGGASVKEEDF